jgi:hypothetical protein
MMTNGRSAKLHRLAPPTWALLTVLSGCLQPVSRFQIVDFREDGSPRPYHESFEEAYYDIDHADNVDIVLRRVEQVAQSPPETITQVVHIRSFWRPIPGKTGDGPTQINGHVSYLIVSGSRGAAFEGAGSILIAQVPFDNDALKGILNGAILKPTRRLATGADLFQRAELSGQFQATRDPHRLVRIINEMNRLFGPLPPHQPPS